MAFELSGDVKFLNETVNSGNLKRTEKNELLNLIKLSEKQKNKTPQRSANPTPNKRVTRKMASMHNENLVLEKTKSRSPGRPSKKNERKPLEILNGNVKTSLMPKGKNKCAPSGRKSTADAVLPTAQGRGTKAEKRNVPKIVVHKDVPNKVKAQGKQNKENCTHKLSKSWDGSNITRRKTRSDGSKSPKLSLSETKKVRHTLNDFTNIKTPGKKNKPKNVGEGKRSPGAKTNHRLTKYKPGHPEFDQILSKLETLFPEIDPEFIKAQLVKFKGSLSEAIEFLIVKEKTDELPTRNDYLIRVETEKLQNNFIKNFSVENFLKMIPDPWEHFLKSEKHNCMNYLGHSLHYLKNKYKKHYLQAIQDALTKNEGSLYLANKELKKKHRTLKMRATNRSKYECDAGKPIFCDIQFIHEVAFIENETKIKSYIKKAETARNKKFKEAEQAGTLLECQSCNDFSLLQDDAVNCPANHVFCKDCVVKYVEIEMGKCNFQFKCLVKCDEKFSIEALQAFLNPSAIARILRRNKAEESKSEEINSLVSCPVCYYVATLSPNRTFLKCLNPSCLVETCRHCKQLNHIPLKCHELEKFDKSILEIEVEIEKKEEEEIEKDEKDPPATCIHCNGEFFKKDDSNLMACPCGATICSICRQPFPECEHTSFETFNNSSHDLSTSSDETEFSEIDRNAAENNFERSSGCSENFLEFLPSESDTF